MSFGSGAQSRSRPGRARNGKGAGGGRTLSVCTPEFFLQGTISIFMDLS